MRGVTCVRSGSTRQQNTPQHMHSSPPRTPEAAFLNQIQNLEAKLRSAASGCTSTHFASAQSSGSDDDDVGGAVGASPHSVHGVDGAHRARGAHSAHSALEEDARLLRLRLEQELSARLQRETSESAALTRRLETFEVQLHEAEAKLVQQQHDMREREVEHHRALEAAAAAAEQQQAATLAQAAAREGSLRAQCAELEARLRTEVAAQAQAVETEKERQRRAAGEVALRANRAMRAVSHAAQEMNLTLEVRGGEVEERWRREAGGLHGSCVAAAREHPGFPGSVRGSRVEQWSCL